MGGKNSGKSNVCSQVGNVVLLLCSGLLVLAVEVANTLAMLETARLEPSVWALSFEKVAALA